MYLPFAKSKETLTSACAVKRSAMGGLGGRSAHARKAVAACPVSGPHPRSAHARQACAEEAPGAELRHGQGTSLTVLMCLGLLVLFLEWSDELIEVVAPRLLHLDNLSEVPLPVVHQVHLEQWRVRRVRCVTSARRRRLRG